METEEVNETDDEFCSEVVLRKQSETAEKLLDRLPSHVRGLLPPVARNSLLKLLHERFFVDLNDLLPKNRTPSTITGAKTLCASATGLIGMNNPSKHDVIDSFIRWSRAFSSFSNVPRSSEPQFATPYDQIFGPHYTADRAEELYDRSVAKLRTPVLFEYLS